MVRTLGNFLPGDSSLGDVVFAAWCSRRGVRGPECGRYFLLMMMRLEWMPSAAK